MFTYAVRRTLQAIPLLLLISILLFSILHAMPGGGLAAYAGNPHLTQADIERLRHNLGLDQPLFIQYLRWLGKVLTGDLGWSTLNSTPVLEAFRERFPATMELMITSFVVSLLIGLTLGILSALRPYSALDYFVTTFAFFGQSMPSFFFALILMYLFAVKGIHFQAFGYAFDIPNLPSAGDGSDEGGGLWDRVRHLILPVSVLALLQVAVWSRFTRASMQEVLHTDYMRTAAAKGLPFMTILLKHGLKNGLMPVITVVALTIPFLVGGALVTEQIFAWQGMGRLFITALFQQDFALLMGYLVIISVLVVLFNLLADLAYGWLDPRVKYD
jgi:peptide/nickel transport system permease protein